MSTTQIIVGCEVGVGLSERTPGGGLSWRVFIATALGWVWTIIVSLGLCAILFCMGELGINVVLTIQPAPWGCWLQYGRPRQGGMKALQTQ